jgi:hypothetical protein
MLPRGPRGGEHRDRAGGDRRHGAAHRAQPAVRLHLPEREPRLRRGAARRGKARRSLAGRLVRLCDPVLGGRDPALRRPRGDRRPVLRDASRPRGRGRLPRRVHESRPGGHGPAPAPDLPRQPRAVPGHLRLLSRLPHVPRGRVQAGRRPGVGVHRLRRRADRDRERLAGRSAVAPYEAADPGRLERARDRRADGADRGARLRGLAVVHARPDGARTRRLSPLVRGDALAGRGRPRAGSGDGQQPVDAGRSRGALGSGRRSARRKS